MKYGIFFVLTQICFFSLVSYKDSSYADCIHTLTWATYLYKDNQHAEAIRWYEPLLEHDIPPLVLTGYFQCLADQGMYERLIALKQTNNEQYEKNEIIQTLFGQALVGVGKTSEAQEHFSLLREKFPCNRQASLYLIQNHMIAKRWDEALVLLEDEIGKNYEPQESQYIYHFFKAQVCLFQGFLEKAHSEVQESLAKNSQFSKAWMLLGLIEEYRGYNHEALKAYMTFLTLEPNMSDILAAHIDKLQQRSSGSTQDTTHVTLKHAAELYACKAYDKACAVLDVYLKQYPTDARGRLLKAQIFLNEKRFEDLIGLLKQWIETPEQRTVWYSVAHRLLHAGCPVASILQFFEFVTKKDTSHIPLLYQSDIYMRTKDYDKALQLFDRIDDETDDMIVKSDSAFQKALIFYEKGNNTSVESALTAGLAQRVVHAPLLNFAAYYYATRGKDLKKAETYVAQALLVEPTNPHYRDTQAVIWYKHGDYAKAEVLLESLTKELSEDGTIFLNLAKVKYKQAKFDEAAQYLAKARTYVHHNHERATIKKLEAKWQLRENNGS